MEKPIRVYQCEDTTDGILSAVYDAGLSGYGHEFIKIRPISDNQIENLELFTEYVPVETDPQKTISVIEAVRNKISREAYSFMMNAVISEFPDRGMPFISLSHMDLQWVQKSATHYRYHV